MARREVVVARRVGCFGVLTHPLLWGNRAFSWADHAFGSPLQDQFDSWILHLQKRD